MKSFLYLLTANVIYFGVVAAIYAFGYDYDNAHKLYPEPVRLSYDLSMIQYGRRWFRYFEYSVWFGLTADLVTAYIWYWRKKVLKKDDLSITSPQP